MRLAAWFRPPRQALTIFLTVAVVSVGALGGLTWQLLAQDRDLETQRQQVQHEQAADRLVAAMQRALTDLQAGVGENQPLPPDVVPISFTSEGVISSSAARLLYLPAPPRRREISPSVFGEGERFEFAAADTAAAVATYTQLSNARDPAVRGGALMRLARVYRKRGADDQALRAYADLAELESVVVDELPAGLAARLGRSSVFEHVGRARELVDESTHLLDDLDAGRWSLTRTQYDTYRALALANVRSPRAEDSDAVARAEAAAWL